MFFVISRFLITGLLLKELDRTGEISLSWFYFRRTLRIFPAFYFYMGVMLVLSASSLNHLTLLGALPALTYTSNYWSEWDAAGYVTSHTWSLATEEQFYLIWPFTLALAGRSRAVWILVAAVVASPILRTMIYLHNGGPTSSLSAFHVNMDHIGMGCLLAFLRERLHNTYWYRRILNSCAFILVPIFIVLATYQQNHPSIHRTVLFFLIAASIALSIDWAITHHKSAVGRALYLPADHVHRRYQLLTLPLATTFHASQWGRNRIYTKRTLANYCESSCGPILHFRLRVRLLPSDRAASA